MPVALTWVNFDSCTVQFTHSSICGPPIASKIMLLVSTLMRRNHRRVTTWCARFCLDQAMSTTALPTGSLLREEMCTKAEYHVLCKVASTPCQGCLEVRDPAW